MKVAANISLMFQELPLLERITYAKSLGFQGVEVQFPYSESPEAWQEALEAAKMPMILFNLPAGDFMQGGYGLACHPHRAADFEAALKLSQTYITALKPRVVNVLAGRQVAGFSRSTCLEQLIFNLKQACQQLDSHDLKITCEPINNFDQPGYLTPRVQHWQEVAAAVDADNFALQLDLYHAARMQEDILDLIRSHSKHLAHLQFADYPDRSHPGSGQLNWKEIWSTLQENRYSGWLAAEFTAECIDDFSWLSTI